MCPTAKLALGCLVSKMSAARKFKLVFALLERQYGRRERYNSRPPVERTLVTALLRDGREKPAEQALRQLEKEFVDLNEMRVCAPEELNRLLGQSSRPGAGQLIADTLTAIFNHAQAMNLDEVMQLAPKQAEAKLRKMNPMPSRVAGELLLANLGYKELPAGAGLLRVVRRLELVQSGSADEQIVALRRLVARPLVPRVLHAFEMLAERVCTPKDFHCRECPIHKHCPTGAAALEKLALDEEKQRAAQEAELRKKEQQEHRATAHKKAATARLKKAIEARSKKLRISAKRTGRRRERTPGAAPVAPQVVQASPTAPRHKRSESVGKPQQRRQAR